MPIAYNAAPRETTPVTLDEANAEAVRRIRAAKESGQWWLDLGDLPIERVPDEIAELKHLLKALALGQERVAFKGVIKWGPRGKLRSQLKSIDSLVSLSTLEQLGLVACNLLANIRPLAGLNTLQRLVAKHCERITTVPHLPGAEFLDFTGCKCLVDYSELSRSTRLCHLFLANCESIQSVEPLRTLRKLQTLTLSGCKQLTSLEPLAGLKKLTSLILLRPARAMNPF